MVDYQDQVLMARILLRSLSPTALERMKMDAQAQKQTLVEIAFRRAGNLLNSYVTYKPGGCLEDY